MSSVTSKRALITGVTGQDGSYLAELLVAKGYDVFGLVRRLSSPNMANLSAVHDKIQIIDGDLIDQSSLNHSVRVSRPDEIYNLAAQSFVATSFGQPVLTGEITGLGAIRLLEAARIHAPEARIYHASSSEMFGRVETEPQDETTPFHPRSPYGVAKVYAYWACINYREAYNMHVSNGILFNHESVTSSTPVIARGRSGLYECRPICELVPDPNHARQREADFEVWDRGQFTRVRLTTAYWNGPANDRRVHRVLVRSGEIDATARHEAIQTEGISKPTETLQPGDRLLRTSLPDPPNFTEVSEDFARFLGLMAAEGSVTFSAKGCEATFRNNDHRLLSEVQRLWERCAGGGASDAPGISDFTGAPTGGLHLLGEQGVLRHLYETLYTRDRSKRVPRMVLNADRAAWVSFLSGYNEGDGLRAGHGNREFKNFKTESPTLAAGLWWMASRVLDQKLTLNLDQVARGEFGERAYSYYSINLGAVGGCPKGKHPQRPPDEVKRVIPERYTGWLYDFETETGTFHAGVGDLVVHNSPRRGVEFVTRKISEGVARIVTGRSPHIVLGNLDARRDWGYAPDYVDLMWRVLQHPTPGEFVGATGESHTVKEFVQEAFRVGGIEDWKSHVQVDPRFNRPSEVYNLRGNPARAKQELGWTPHTRFKDLVRIMVEADLERLGVGHGKS
jgi:GDPmannose 4,6-dehydratase